MPRIVGDTATKAMVGAHGEMSQHWMLVREGWLLEGEVAYDMHRQEGGERWDGMDRWRLRFAFKVEGVWRPWLSPLSPLTVFAHRQEAIDFVRELRLLTRHLWMGGRDRSLFKRW